MTARKSEAGGGGGGDEAAVLPGGGNAAPARNGRSTLGTLRKLLREEGLGSLFAGVLPALVLVVNPILQYTIFEQLKNALERRRKGAVGPRDAFYLGAIGKLLATTITYPYITVKSRAHVASGDGPKDSMMQSLKRVVREEGWAGLYGGEFCGRSPHLVRELKIFQALDPKLPRVCSLLLFCLRSRMLYMI